MDALSSPIDEISEKIQFTKQELLKVYPVTHSLKVAPFSKVVSVLGK